MPKRKLLAPGLEKGLSFAISREKGRRFNRFKAISRRSPDRTRLKRSALKISDRITAPRDAIPPTKAWVSKKAAKNPKTLRSISNLVRCFVIKSPKTTGRKGKVDGPRLVKNPRKNITGIRKGSECFSWRSEET